MNNDSARTRELRVNDVDLSALKTARDEFDTSVALGYVARVGAKKIVEDSNEEEPEFV